MDTLNATAEEDDPLFGSSDSEVDGEEVGGADAQEAGQTPCTSPEAVANSSQEEGRLNLPSGLVLPIGNGRAIPAPPKTIAKVAAQGGRSQEGQSQARRQDAGGGRIYPRDPPSDGEVRRFVTGSEKGLTQNVRASCLLHPNEHLLSSNNLSSSSSSSADHLSHHTTRAALTSAEAVTAGAWRNNNPQSAQDWLIDPALQLETMQMTQQMNTGTSSATDRAAAAEALFALAQQPEKQTVRNSKGQFQRKSSDVAAEGHGQAASGVGEKRKKREATGKKSKEISQKEKQKTGPKPRPTVPKRNEIPLRRIAPAPLPPPAIMTSHALADEIPQWVTDSMVSSLNSQHQMPMEEMATEEEATQEKENQEQAQDGTAETVVPGANVNSEDEDEDEDDAAALAALREAAAKRARWARLLPRPRHLRHRRGGLAVSRKKKQQEEAEDRGSRQSSQLSQQREIGSEARDGQKDSQQPARTQTPEEPSQHESQEQNEDQTQSQDQSQSQSQSQSQDRDESQSQSQDQSQDQSQSQSQDKNQSQSRSLDKDKGKDKDKANTKGQSSNSKPEPPAQRYTNHIPPLRAAIKAKVTAIKMTQLDLARQYYEAKVDAQLLAATRNEVDARIAELQRRIHTRAGIL